MSSEKEPRLVKVTFLCLGSLETCRPAMTEYFKFYGLLKPNGFKNFEISVHKWIRRTLINLALIVIQIQI